MYEDNTCSSVGSVKAWKPTTNRYCTGQRECCAPGGVLGCVFPMRLSYLYDIFSALNYLNRKLQGKGTNILFGQNQSFRG